MSAFLADPRTSELPPERTWLAYKTQGNFSTAVVAVVAYNGAMQPSAMVCSDGVTVDRTNPTVSSVHLDHVYIRPGFASERAEGAPVWLVRDDRTRVLVRDTGAGVPGSSCANPEIGALAVNPRLPSFPVALDANTSMPLRMPPAEEAALCASLGAAGTVAYHFAGGSHLSVRWLGGDDESGIRDFHVIVASEAEVKGDLFARMGIPSHKRQHMTIKNANIEDGSVFYIVVVAVNNAGLEGIEIAGPFEVDTFMPSAAPDDAVSVSNRTGMPSMEVDSSLVTCNVPLPTPPSPLVLLSRTTDTPFQAQCRRRLHPSFTMSGDGQCRHARNGRERCAVADVQPEGVCPPRRRSFHRRSRHWCFRPVGSAVCVAARPLRWQGSVGSVQGGPRKYSLPRRECPDNTHHGASVHAFAAGNLP